MKLGLNSFGTSWLAYEITLKYGRLENLSMDSWPHWLKFVSCVIIPLTFIVGSHDVAKGPQRLNRKAHDVLKVGYCEQEVKLTSCEMDSHSCSVKAFTTIGIPNQYLRYFLIK